LKKLGKALAELGQALRDGASGAFVGALAGFDGGVSQQPLG